MKRAFLGLILGFSLSTAATEISVTTNGTEVLFGEPRLAVRFDVRTGLPKVWSVGGKDVLSAASAGLAPLDVQEETKSWSSARQAPYVGLGFERVDERTLCSRIQNGPWRFDCYCQLRPERRMVRRWFDVEWTESKPSKFHGFRVDGGCLNCPSKEAGYLLPAHFPRCDRTRGSFEHGRRNTSWRSPFPVLGDNGQGIYASWMMDELVPYADGGSNEVIESADGFSVRTSFACKGYVRKGVKQRVGDIWTCFGSGTRETALEKMSDWFREVGQIPPADRPEWLKKMTLYSMHPGGTTGSLCRDWGGFSAATAYLPRMRELGCTAVWLMPLEDQSIYCPRDYYKLQQGIGTPDDYRRFVKEAHALGMKVWQDCVPHGGGNQNERAKAHPEWLAYDENGKSLDYWCFDFMWPSWIEYMAGVVSWYTREYGIDGFRIDAVTGSKIPNWNKDIPYARASMAQSQGGLAMQRALRKAVKAVNPDGANLAEAGPSIHGATSDATYDFDLCYMVFRSFARRLPEEAVPMLRRWFHEQRLSEIPDLIRMRHSESHDSLRAGLQYGVGASEALMSVISWVPGIPLVYQEMEDESYDAFREIFRIRAEHDELTLGDVDYLSPSVPDGIFACRRRLGKREAIPLVNFFGTNVVCTVRLPQDVSADAKYYDARTGAAIQAVAGRLAVPLKPFGSTVLLNSPCRHVAPAVGAADGASRDGLDAIKKVGGEWMVRIPSATQWTAYAAEGAIGGPYRVRHPNFEAQRSPIYRFPQGGNELWNSALHPFGVNDFGAMISVECGSDCWTFEPKGGVRILDRLGDDHCLHLAFKTKDVRVTHGRGDPPETRTGDERLAALPGGWLFDNGRIRLQIQRNGSLVGYWRKESDGQWIKMLTAGVYTDKGYGDRRYAQEKEVETVMRFARDEAGLLTLSFAGHLRNDYRFAKMRHPVEYATTYRLGDDDCFRLEQEVRATGEAANGRAFLALMAESPVGISSATFSDSKGGKKEASSGKSYRFLQADEKSGLPVCAELRRQDGRQIVFSDVRYGDLNPETVMASWNAFFVCWQNNKGNPFPVGRKVSVSMTIR